MTASDAIKDSTPATGTGKETTVPKKKPKKTNADKGIVIISDNPSGPPLDDVSFLRLPSCCYCFVFSRDRLLTVSLVFQPITQEYLNMASRAIGFRSEADTLRSNFAYFDKYLAYLYSPSNCDILSQILLEFLKNTPSNSRES